MSVATAKAAERLGVSAREVRRLITTGELSASSYIDLVAPEGVPVSRLPRIQGGHPIRIEAGRQALQRIAVAAIQVDGQKVDVPVPELPGAVVHKSAAWAAGSRGRERHGHDVACLASLMCYPLSQRARFAGSDRRRLRKLDSVLMDPHAQEWAASGAAATVARLTWRILLS